MTKKSIISLSTHASRAKKRMSQCMHACMHACINHAHFSHPIAN
jgi:hypothetical protein